MSLLRLCSFQIISQPNQSNENKQLVLLFSKARHAVVARPHMLPKMFFYTKCMKSASSLGTQSCMTHKCNKKTLFRKTGLTMCAKN